MLEHRRHHEALAIEHPAPIEHIKDARHHNAIEQLNMGIERASNEPGYRAALDVFRHLYHYSPGNQIRIYGQFPAATLVNSYDRWKESKRQVKRGERGIKVYYPQFRIFEVENDEGKIEPRKMLTGFGEGNVFDISQTEGPDIEIPVPSLNFSTTDAALELDRRVSLQGIGKGIIFEQKPLPERYRGFFEPRTNRVVLNNRLPADDGRLKTLVHEYIHALEHGKQGHEERDLSEVIAEGGAYTLLGYHGIDTAEYSFPYVTSYAFDRDVMKIALPRIAAVTKDLITGVAVEDPERAPEWL